jgi:hypothetical protein
LAADAKRALGPLCAGLLLVLLWEVPAAAADRPSPGRSEQAVAEAIRAGRVPDDADPRFVAAITTIDGLRGQVEFDAAGRLVGADLASDRISVTDAELARLSALPNLKKLRVSGGGVTRAGIDQISRMAGLTDLSLLNVQIDNDGLERLAQLPQLAALSVHRSALVDDAGLAHLKRFPKLANLSLLEVNITNQGVAGLVRDLPSLTARSAQLRPGGQPGPRTSARAEEPESPAPWRLPDQRPESGHRQGPAMAGRLDGSGGADHRHRPGPAERPAAGRAEPLPLLQP